MNHPQDRLAYLHERMIAGQATDQEQAEFYELLSDPALQDKFSTILKRRWESLQSDGKVSNKQIQIFANKIFAHTTRSGTERSISAPWLKYAAAIFLVVGSSVIGYNLISKTDKKTLWEGTAVSVKPVIQPGSDKAVLTLADGTSIQLDESKTGVIAQQAGLALVKTSAGTIEYTSAGGVQPKAEGFNQMTTPRGGRFQVLLPDGSSVWLNSASSLRYPVVFQGNNRRVELDGEAYFDIKENKGKPFIVSTDRLQVKVLGTAFNLNAYKDEPMAAATLVRGSVLVRNEIDSVIIKPGQQARMASLTQSAEVGSARLEEILAWKEGKFKFEGADIRMIMRQISRWYDVDIIYKGTVPQTVFNGSLLRTASPAALLEALTLTGNVHFLIQEKSIIVMPGKVSN